MISLRLFASALVVCVLVAHASAFWGSSGYYGQQNPRFRSSYYSPSQGYGLSSYGQNSWGGRYNFYGRGYRGGFWNDEYDDMDRNQYYGRDWS